MPFIGWLKVKRDIQNHHHQPRYFAVDSRLIFVDCAMLALNDWRVQVLLVQAGGCGSCCACGAVGLAGKPR